MNAYQQGIIVLGVFNIGLIIYVLVLIERVRKLQEKLVKYHSLSPLEGKV